MKKSIFSFLFFSFLFLSSCQNKSSFLIPEDIDVSEDDLIYASASDNTTGDITSDDIFLSFSEAVYNLHYSLNQLSYDDLSTKNANLQVALGNLSSTLSLDEFADLNALIYQIDKEIFTDYFEVINSNLNTFSSPNFESEYTNFLATNLPDYNLTQAQTRWFLAALGSLLGAGECTKAVLGVVDTAAYVATAILTSPTGAGAVATAGGAVTSYGNAFVNANDCMYPEED